MVDHNQISTGAHRCAARPAPGPAAGISLGVTGHGNVNKPQMRDKANREATKSVGKPQLQVRFVAPCIPFYRDSFR
jgi:hypothetical protein